MKLNRAMLWATAATAAVMVVGAVSVVGIDRSSDENLPPAGAEFADAVSAVDGDATEVAANANGVEEYRGGGSSHGGSARGGGSHGGAGHGFTHGGFGHGYGRGGYGHGWGGRGWGGSRWGRWGGGRYVGGRWVGGPYYGWCDGRYYACNRYWG